MKKIVALLLGVIVCIPQMFHTVFAESLLNQEAVDLLRALGVIEEEYDAGAEITRGQFAFVLSKITYMPDSYQTETSYFTDVDIASEEGKAIYLLKEFGHISGYPDGTYRPDEPILYEHALGIMVKMCGYEMLMDAEYDVLSIASRLGLGKSLGCVVGGTLTYEQALGLAFQLLEAELPSIKGNIINVENQTYAQRYLGLEKYSGIVKSDGIIALNGKLTIGPEEILINDKVFTMSKEKNSLLGKSVICWYRENKDEAVVVSLTETNKNQMLTIEAKHIENYENGVYEYINDDYDTSVKKARLADGCYVIYNGLAVGVEDAGDFSQDMFNVKNGKITLLDNNDDGRYEVVYIDSYEYYLVETVDSYSETVYCKDGTVLNLKDSYEYIIYRDGKEITVDKIAKNDVISYMKRLNESIKIIVSAKTVEGKIESVNEDYIVIDGGTYFYDEKFVPRNGITGIFYLSEDGIVVGSEETKGSIRYAYLLRAGVDELSDTLFLRCLDEDGTVKMLNASERVSVDGIKYKVAEEAFNALKGADGETNKDVIRYKLNNDGVVTWIDTVIYQSGNEDSDSIRRTDNLDGTNRYYITEQRTFSGKDGILDDDTLVFQIPRDTTDVDHMKVLTFSQFDAKGSNTYSVKGYINKDESLTLAAVAIAPAQTSDSRPAFITELNQALYEDEVKLCITCIGYGGTEYTFYIDEERTKKEINGVTLTLDVGDIIRYTNNGDGTLEDISYVYDYDTKYYAKISGNAYGEKFDCNLAWVAQKDDNAIRFVYEEPTSDNINMLLSDAGIYWSNFPVYVYHPNSKGGKIEKGTVADLRDFVKYGYASHVFYSSRFGFRDYILVYADE